MPILKNIGLMVSGSSAGSQTQLSSIPHAAIAWHDGKITWLGSQDSIPADYSCDEIHDAGGLMAIPGLIDYHTHLAFAGWRSDEFERKLLGSSYEEIASQGGGILSTVKKTRLASHEELLERTTEFAWQMAALGVTTIEAKSGYGLNVDTELKILEVYALLSERLPITIVPTLLAAHTVAPEFTKDRSAYVNLIVKEIIPAAAAKSLARFCDAFVENIAFSKDEARLILEAAKKFGMAPKLHVDQLRDGGGAQFAAEIGAVSADHLEHSNADGLRAMAQAGVVAVVLPFAALHARQPVVDLRKLASLGVPFAIATDFNPGTAPSYHLPIALSLACVMSRATPAEALNAATIVAARALRLENEIGSLEVGKYADIALIEASSVNEWLYQMTPNSCRATFKRGERIFQQGMGNRV